VFPARFDSSPLSPSLGRSLLPFRRVLFFLHSFPLLLLFQFSKPFMDLSPSVSVRVPFSEGHLTLSWFNYFFPPEVALSFFFCTFGISNAPPIFIFSSLGSVPPFCANPVLFPLLFYSASHLSLPFATFSPYKPP